MKTITCKLGKMRKAQEWVIYPKPKDNQTNEIVIQSDTRICSFDPLTRMGRLSVSRANGASFIHLYSIMGATQIEIPKEIVDQIIANVPQPGDFIGGGVVVG